MVEGAAAGQVRRLAIVAPAERAARMLAAVTEHNRLHPASPISTVVVHPESERYAWPARHADEAVSLPDASLCSPRGDDAVIAALRGAGADAAWLGSADLAGRESLVTRCVLEGIQPIGADPHGARTPASLRALAADAGIALAADAAVALADPGPAAPGDAAVPDRAAGPDRAAPDDAADPERVEARQPAAGAGPGRRVEVVVLADGHGTCWAAGIVECTVRRDGLRLLEESPAPGLDGSGAALAGAAVRVVRAGGWRGVAAVAFHLRPDGRPFLAGAGLCRHTHPAIEETTGIDLAAMRLHIALGGALPAQPPLRGHAVQVRLSLAGRGPAPVRLEVFDPPAGPGIRVDCVVRPGDTVPAGERAPIATVTARGDDRTGALARLARALSESTVVVPGARSDRADLLAVLGRPDLVDLSDRRAGGVDTGWLDRLTAAGALRPAADPLAVLCAAVEAYEADHAAERSAFLAAAARGRPEPPRLVGHRFALRYRGTRYPLRVFRTGPGGYRVDHAGTLVDVAVNRVNRYERRVTVAGAGHRILVVPGAPGELHLDIDGAAHHVRRDDDEVVRSGWPAFVTAVLVRRGQRVAAGEAVAVVESMKMQTTITAPVAGEVTTVDVAANTQVDTGAPLLRIRTAPPPDGAGTPGGATGPAIALGAGAPAPDREPASDRDPATDRAVAPERLYGALRGYLLGYDLDPTTLRGLSDRQRALDGTVPPADPGLLRGEDELIDLFVDVGSLCRPRTGADGIPAGHSSQEYLLAFLQWLDADRAGLPDGYRHRLERALARYGVPGLARTPQLENAVVWMYRSFTRVGEFAAVVSAVLARRLHRHRELAHLADPAMRARLDRLVAVTERRLPEVADLARDVRTRFLDEPMLAAETAREVAGIESALDALRAARHDPDGQARDCADRLAGASRPIGAQVLRRWITDPDPAFRRLLLQVYARRFHPGRAAGELTVHQHAGHLVCSTRIGTAGTGTRLVVAFAPLDDLPELSRSVARHLAGTGRDGPQAGTGPDGSDGDTPPPGSPGAAAPGGGGLTVDLATWRAGGWPDDEAMLTEVQKLLAACDFGPRLDRLNITVSNAADATPGGLRTRHLTFTHGPDGAFTEQPLYRDLHPTLADRLELWRLSNFRLRRLPCPDGIYLFHGTATDNDEDQRLFALAELRDLTPGTDAATGETSYPRLELLGLTALSSMRAALGTLPRRPAANRLVIYVRPSWTVPHRAWRPLARRLAPSAAGLGLEKAVLRVRLPRSVGGPHEAVLHVEGLGVRGITVRERPVGDRPVRPLTAYRQKVLRAQRSGAPYPYEIVRLLTPPPGAVARFPSGQFVEHDLDGEGALVPVDRPHGRNTANVVVGVLTSFTAKVPEGMVRVAVLGDPTRGLGNVAEPECRRIIGALDLAQRLRVPMEWFTLSSGAKIAMDSGTENMDWIAAVLRRLIEFTQDGGEVNVVVTGVNVGAQPYWNAEATMLMHTRGILVMTPDSSMVLTGKQALDFSGGVSAEDNFGIGGFDRIMGPNGQAQYWAPSWEDACDLLLRHYEHSYVVPGERFPRPAASTDPVDRDIRTAPHPRIPGIDIGRVGDIFSDEHNPDRKNPFDIRAVMRAVCDVDARPLERWAHWRGADTVVVWDSHIGGIATCLLGVQSRTVPRRGFVPADGPPSWASGTLFPQSSRKMARAINAASGNRPVVVLANLSGFDGSPESMRRWQLEYGAEIGRAVTNFAGPMVFLVISRYHGGAFVVFSKRLNEHLEIAAVQGSYASVIGGAPAAATVFARDVRGRTEADPAVRAARAQLRGAAGDEAARLRARLAETTAEVRSAKLGEVAEEFDGVHTIGRALEVGSVDRIVAAGDIRPYLVDALRRGMARNLATTPAPWPATAPAGVPLPAYPPGDAGGATPG